MLRQVVDACPDDAWEQPVANGSARWGAYHALVFTEVYLGQSEEAYEPSEFYREGGEELGDQPGRGLSRGRTLQYLRHCLALARSVVAVDSLAAPDGFGRGMSRLQMHLYNIRHIQHHAAQLSAHVRRQHPLTPHRAMPWIGRGWREPSAT